MKNRTVATAAANLIICVDWNRTDLDPQQIIDAAKDNRIQGPLTDWLASGAWNKGKFVAKDKFVVDTSRNAKVKISYLGDNFRSWHLGAVEDLPPIAELLPFVLPEDMLDKDIIAKLGGVSKVITSLCEVFGKMQDQPEGPKSAAGPLHTDGRGNLFYVPQPVKKLTDNSFSYIGSDGQEKTAGLKDSPYLFEVNGQWYVLRAVDVGWGGEGWCVGAYSVEAPDERHAGFRVLSRNSVLKLSEPASAVS